MKLEGKIVAITGAASGLGRSTAIVCAGEGAAAFLIDRDREGLEATAASIRAAGGSATIHLCDLSRRQDCFDAIDAAVACFGKLDGLCNIAGIVKFHHVGDVTEAEWSQILAVNLSAPFYLSQAAIPELIKTHGAIVNVASSGGIKGTAYTVPYSISKAGLIQMTRAMAMEFVKAPIRINAMAPGAMDTEMNSNLLAGGTMPEGIDRTLVGAYSGFRSMADPAGMARMIAYMLSDETPAMHGAVVSVDGGITAG